MLALIQSDRSTEGYISSTRNSPLAEFEIGPDDYVIQGAETLNLTVIR